MRSCVPAWSGVVLLVVLGACRSDRAADVTAPADGGPRRDAAGVDSGDGGGSAGPDGGDAAPDAVVDAGGGEVGDAAPNLGDAASTGDAAAGDGGDGGELPGPGEPGGVCRPDGSCDSGECLAVRGERLCAVDCGSNEDCGPALRCEAVAADRMVCLGGVRGTGALGDICADSGNDCASALCLEAEPLFGRPDGLCTQTCSDERDCAAPLPVCEVWFGSGLCLPVEPGSTGGLCHPSGTACDATGDECTDLGALGPRCSHACAVDADCGQTWLRCLPGGGDGGLLCLVAAE